MKGNTKNPGDIIGSLILMTTGIAIIAGSIRLRVGTLTKPQPGLFPFLAGFFLVALSCLLIIQGWHGRGEKTRPFGEVKKPAMLAIGMAIYVVILNPVGFALATIPLGAVILRVLGVTSWKVLTLSSLLLSIGTYLLFSCILGVELPAGVLEGIWIF